SDLDVLHLAADLDDLAGIFVAEHPADGVGKLGDVQVAAADAAAADLEHHLVGLRRRIGHGLDRERLADRAEHGCFHDGILDFAATVQVVMVQPASTGSATPVTSEAASVQSHTTTAATSSGRPTLPVACNSAPRASTSIGPKPWRVIGMSMKPGQTAFTRMPALA